MGTLIFSQNNNNNKQIVTIIIFAVNTCQRSIYQIWLKYILWAVNYTVIIVSILPTKKMYFNM